MTQEHALVAVGTRPLLATKANVEVMERFIQVMDPNADAKLRWSLAVVAVRLGLHPLNNEVMLYEGQVFITIHGRRRLAERNGDLAAIQPDIVTDDARRKAMGATSRGDIVGMCYVYRRSDERPTIQYGLVRANERWPSENEMVKLGVTQEEVQKLRNNDDPDGLFAIIKNPRAKVRPIILQPHIMAMKRAEARALDSLAGVPLPTFDPEMGAQVTNGVLPAFMLQEDPDPAAPTATAEPTPTAPSSPPPVQASAPPTPPPASMPEPTTSPSTRPPAPPTSRPPAQSTSSRRPAQGALPVPCANNPQICGCPSHIAERAARRA